MYPCPPPLNVIERIRSGFFKTTLKCMRPTAVHAGSSLKGASFINAVITGSTFDDADLTDAVFIDSLIGQEDIKRLCQNKSVVGETRFQVGCRN